MNTHTAYAASFVQDAKTLASQIWSALDNVTLNRGGVADEDYYMVWGLCHAIQNFSDTDDYFRLQRWHTMLNKCWSKFMDLYPVAQEYDKSAAETRKSMQDKSDEYWRSSQAYADYIEGQN